jgi:polysaccharide biosynthesis protein PelE
MTVAENAGADAIDDAPQPGALGLAFVTLSSFAVEAGLLWAWAEGSLPGGGYGFFAGHVMFTALLALWVVRRGRRGYDQRFPGLLMITTAFMGPSGPLCAGLCAVMHAIFRRYATGFHDWYLSLFPESQSAPAQELYELIVAGRERAGAASVESFTDVMTVGSPQQKQAVIALVARHFRPSFTPALRLGLADADPSVRVQAATATARVEHEFNERWQKLEHAADSNEDDAVSHHALARHLDDYAFCGLLDANRELELRQKSLGRYRTALSKAPDDAGLRSDMGRLLLRVGLVEEAAAVLAPAVERVHDRRLLAWYAESLFRLGRFTELRALCRARRADFRDNAAIFDTLGDVVRLWLEDEAPATANDAGAAGIAAE